MSAKCKYCGREFKDERSVAFHVGKSPACKAAKAAGAAAGAAAHAAPTLTVPEGNPAMSIAYKRAVYEYTVEYDGQVFALDKEYVQDRGNVYTLALVVDLDDTSRRRVLGTFQAKDGRPARVHATEPAYEHFVKAFAEKFARDKRTRLMTKSERDARADAAAS